VTAELTHQSSVASHSILSLLVTGEVNVSIAWRTTVIVVLDRDVDTQKRQEELMLTHNVVETLPAVSKQHTQILVHHNYYYTVSGKKVNP